MKSQMKRRKKEGVGSRFCLVSFADKALSELETFPVERERIVREKQDKLHKKK